MKLDTYPAEQLAKAETRLATLRDGRMLVASDAIKERVLALLEQDVRRYRAMVQR